jgi:hypothetical protein
LGLTGWYLSSTILGLWVLSGCAPTATITTSPPADPVVVVREVVKEVLVEVVRETIRIVEVPVDRIIPEYRAPRQFISPEELDTYLNDKPAYMAAEGQDCDDTARFMMLDCLKDGFWVSLQVVDSFRGGGRHMLISAVIGNAIYYIEPSSLEYWWAMPVD